MIYSRLSIFYNKKIIGYHINKEYSAKYDFRFSSSYVDYSNYYYYYNYYCYY